MNRATLSIGLIGGSVVLRYRICPGCVGNYKVLRVAQGRCDAGYVTIARTPWFNGELYIGDRHARIRIRIYVFGTVHTTTLYNYYYIYSSIAFVCVYVRTQGTAVAAAIGCGLGEPSFLYILCVLLSYRHRLCIRTVRAALD